MTMRTIRSSVTFAAPFILKGFVEPHPAGTFDIETDEEAIEGHEWTGYRRISTLITLRDSTGCRTCTIDPVDLAAAIERDRLQAEERR